MTSKDDHRSCTNLVCDIRLSCARTADEDYQDGQHAFNAGMTEGVWCRYFVLRKALGRGDPDQVFKESRRRGRRHNAHANLEPRKEYPAAEVLFGKGLAQAMKSKKRAPRPTLHIKTDTPKPTEPDLMVKRHLKDGEDINLGKGND